MYQNALNITGAAGFWKMFFASLVMGYFRKQLSDAEPQQGGWGALAAVVACQSDREAGRQRVWEPKAVLAGDVDLRGRGGGARTARDACTTSAPCRSSSAPEGLLHLHRFVLRAAIQTGMLGYSDQCCLGCSGSCCFHCQNQIALSQKGASLGQNALADPPSPRSVLASGQTQCCLLCLDILDYFSCLLRTLQMRLLKPTIGQGTLWTVLLVLTIQPFLAHCSFRTASHSQSLMAGGMSACSLTHDYFFSAYSSKLQKFRNYFCFLYVVV